MLGSIKLAWYRTQVSTALVTSPDWIRHFEKGHFKEIMDRLNGWSLFNSITEAGYKDGKPASLIVEAFWIAFSETMFAAYCQSVGEELMANPRWPLIFAKDDSALVLNKLFESMVFVASVKAFFDKGLPPHFASSAIDLKSLHSIYAGEPPES